MARYRNTTNISKTLKDYAVPLVGLFLIVILLFSVFSGDGDDNINKTEIKQNSNNSFGVKVNNIGEDSKTYIVYKNGKKVEIENNIDLSKSEKVVVESGVASIDFPSLASMKLKENGELSYKEDGSIFLESGNLWIESISDMNVFMKFGEVSIPKGSIVNLSQNDLESTIYSIDGDILVSNLAGKTSLVKGGEKLSIKSKDANNDEINLDSLKTEIDDYFKLSSWFKENGGDNILSNQKTLDSDTGSLLVSSGSTIDKKEDIKKLIIFDNLKDESFVNKNPINISGRYSPIKVSKITINNLDTQLNKELGTFSLKNFNLENKVNDLVVKVFDKNANLIKKEVITIYTKNGNSIKNNKLNSKLENYKVKATDFVIYEPTKTGKLTTKSSQVTIRGLVKNKSVKSVLVNDYKLRSFNGKTWRYHAFVDQGTLKNGTNIYEIKYLGEGGKLIYKEYYSIYKESNKILKKETKKISDEAKIN